MNETKARELINKYVLENFDDRWHPDPMYLEEYADVFEFGINSKEYLATGDLNKSFVGLGSAYISKKFGEIVQNGTAVSPHYCLQYFLLTEYRLNIVRTKYEIERADYYYELAIKDITDVEKATKYIEGIWIYEGDKYRKKICDGRILEFSRVDYFSLLNLLYFNVIDPFCECLYRKLISKDDLSYPLRSFKSQGTFESSDRLFYRHIFERVNHVYPIFEINKNYSACISEIFDDNKFNQYFSTVRFKHYGEDEQTGWLGYTNYSYDELALIMQNQKKTFDFVEGYELLFFLFMNTIEPFCEISIEIMPDTQI
ncbi:hypothetical protein [Flavobacterium sp. H122]|uniref:hypothetical protein n=1 Tax=Flavobacterium sp. H122 TaxID=2529860 RepID=UPI0010AA3536|nr:hypothetical protein [Flavobacterium sp. H122]